MADWCENCIHSDKEYYEEPCATCEFVSNSEPTEYVVKSCDNCLHSKCDDFDDPCFSCEPYGEDNWEAAVEETPKETVTDDVKETVNHPEHYQGKYECIEEMINLFGIEAVKDFCKCNVYKYRFRAGRKQGEEYEKDISKAENYMTILINLEERTINND